MKRLPGSEDMRAQARKRALEALDRRLADGEGGSDALGGLLSRDPEAAAATADAVMARVGRGTVRGHAGFRAAYVLAAAAALVVVSSLLTLALSGGRDVVEVHFVLAAPEAGSVSLAADFNGWSLDSHVLERREDGTWEIVVPLSKGASYRYGFVVDGERWVPDPRSSILLDDGFGGTSSSISL